MPLLTPVVIVWSLSAVLSAGYLFTLAVVPDWLADLTPASVRQTERLTGPSSTETRLVAEVEGLRGEVAQLETKVETLQRETAAVRTTLNDEVGSLKAVFAGGTSAVTDSGSSDADARQTLSTPVPPPVRRPKTANAAPKPTTPTTTGTVVPNVINGSSAAAPAAKAKPVETGSVTKAAKAAVPAAAPKTDPIAFGQAVVTRPGATALGVVISSGETVDGLRLSWSALSERYGSVLSGLEPRYMLSTDPSGASFELVAGPIASQANAEETCQQIRAANLPCRVGAYGGNAL